MNTPSAPSRSTCDTIEVRGLSFLGLHGVYDEEREEGRRFDVDVEVDVPRADAAGSDALAATLDYRDIAAVVVEVLEGPSVHLIETLGSTICDRLFDLHEAVLAARVVIRKIATGVPGNPATVGVRFHRLREDTRGPA